MKMKVAMKNNVDHDSMAVLFNFAVAGQLKQSLMREGLEPSEVWPFVESAVFDLAMMFDQGKFEINGRVFRPRISFVSEDGNVLPGSADYDHLHDYGIVTEEDLEDQKGFSLKF